MINKTDWSVFCILQKIMTKYKFFNLSLLHSQLKMVTYRLSMIGLDIQGANFNLPLDKSSTYKKLRMELFLCCLILITGGVRNTCLHKALMT